MARTTLVEREGKTWVPDYLLPAHELCFLHHDILVELLRSGEEEGSFSQRFQFRDDAEREAFEDSADVFEWFERTGRGQDRAAFLRRTVFPALLSDLLHFVYEALESSRKAKLNVAYALIRKPIQENLFLMEIIAADVDQFTEHLVNSPLKLHSQKAGSFDAHVKRISLVLDALGEQDRFDAEYLARLRYDKAAEDGFDGICNKAIHLFTGHKAIETERLNVNFIFSDWGAKMTQWYYLYSRLPYLLDYTRLVVEHVYARFERTDPVYLDEMNRRMMAATLLWAPAVDEHYRNEIFERYVKATWNRLVEHCIQNQRRPPTPHDLRRMKESGAFPGESPLRTKLRHARYSALTLPRRLGRGLKSATRKLRPFSSGDS